eukprot:3471133-Prymnesium_polylepis.2
MLRKQRRAAPFDRRMGSSTGVGRLGVAASAECENTSRRQPSGRCCVLGGPSGSASHLHTLTSSRLPQLALRLVERCSYLRGRTRASVRMPSSRDGLLCSRGRGTIIAHSCVG